MTGKKRFHIIAIGGSITSSLAIELHNEGYNISGSDDCIHDPAKSRLQSKGLLPQSIGWFVNKLDESIDAVILGMHAKKDNPELLQAQKLNLPIYSFPDYIFSRSKDKQRIVIGGSHGKTTITSLVTHVLNFHQKQFDYVVGASSQGMDHTVKISDAPIIIIEGDEYLSSPLDNTPKLMKYHHHIGLISGIAWDHVNVFASKESYYQVFNEFAKHTPKGGTLICNKEDGNVEEIGKRNQKTDIDTIFYSTQPYTTNGSTVSLISKKFGHIPIQIFGKHNLQNIAAAKALLNKLGITSAQFYEAIPSFKGPEGRLTKVFENQSCIWYEDFAHAPSKVKAVTQSVKESYPQRLLVGCLELHTFSSLNKSFLSEYERALHLCETAIVYYNKKHTLHKTESGLSTNEIRQAFACEDLLVFNDKNLLVKYLLSLKWENQNLIMMSSSNFNNLDINDVLIQSSLQTSNS